jgi:uncharacterized cupin superfamily protein
LYFPTEIYADDTGETHLRDTQVSFELRDFAPPSAPIGVSPKMNMTTAVFLELPLGWDLQFHPTPRKQLVAMLRGYVTVTTSDGASTDFRQGDVVMLNDQGSKGHLTVVRGQESVTMLLVGVAD